MTDHTDLIERLRSLARVDHCDLSVGDEAAEAIESLQDSLKVRDRHRAAMRKELAEVREQLATARLEQKLAVDELAAVKAQLAEARELLADWHEWYQRGDGPTPRSECIDDDTTTWLREKRRGG